MVEERIKLKLFLMCYFIYLFKDECPTLRAADAAGAAPDLGATFWRGGVPALVPIYGGCQRRR